MIELWIDDQMCDIEKLPAIPINYDIVRLADVEGARSGRTIELELPVTSRNEAMFAPSRDIYATSRFNNQHHRAVVKRNGVVVFEGTAYLRSTTINKECSGCYSHWEVITFICSHRPAPPCILVLKSITQLTGKIKL